MNTHKFLKEGAGRWVIALMLAWCLMAAGGCTAIRAVGMRQLGEREIPAPEGGTVTSIRAEGRIIPTVRIEITSSKPVNQTVEWYGGLLEGRGWKLTGGTWDAEKQSRFLASRVTLWHGLQVVREELELRMEAKETGSVGSVTLWGDYVWDFPSALVVSTRGGAAYPLGYSWHMLCNGDAGERMWALLLGMPTALLMEALCVPGEILWWIS